MADTTQRDKIDKLYGGLRTLPGLIGDLALSVAQAQVRLDQNYIESLAAFTKIVQGTIAGVGADGKTAAAVPAKEFLDLFKAIAPSRYQFTETVIEVRADLQTTSADEIKVDATVGITRPVLAATVNVSYLKRSASDYQATAVVRCVLNAIPADSTIIDKLLDRAGPPPTATLRADPLFKGITEALGDISPKQAETTPPAPPAPPVKPQP